MKEERLLILKMIEDGKINVDDGIKLLNAIKLGKSFKRSEMEDKLSKAVKTVDAFAKDVKLKVEDFTKDAEPKVKEAGKFVLDKTSVAFDEIGKAIKSAMDSGKKDNPSDEEFDIVYEDMSEEDE